jgi:hypothetical protein
MSDRPRLDVAVYGLINAGKSSLINALAGASRRPTGPIGGTTTEVAELAWREVDAEVGGFDVRLLDTPGLEEVGDETRSDVATEAATRADLVVFVVAEDLTATARAALLRLREVGKPTVVTLNKVDLLAPAEESSVLSSIRERLEGIVPPEDVVAIAAAPVVRERGADGRVEARRGEPRVEALVGRLLVAVAESGEDLKEMNAVRERIEAHVPARDRAKAERRERAERVADETSAALALALAINPIPLLDFLTGPGGLAILVTRVSAVYGESPTAEAARSLAGELVRGGRAAFWGSAAAVVAGGAMKVLPGLGHVAGALTQGVSAGYLSHVLGRALVGYLESGHDWGDGGLVAALEAIAARTDRKAITRGLAGRIKDRLRPTRRPR